MQINYPKELKILVCKEVIENRRKPKTIAKNYNLNINTLYSWLSKYKKDKNCFIGKGRKRPDDFLISEIKKLEEENRFYKLILQNIK